MNKLFACLLFFSVWTGGALAETPRYGVAPEPVPVLNVPDFSKVFGGRDGRSLKTDRCGQVRELEFIALPGTPFRILGEARDGTRRIYRVETDDYPVPPDQALYVDAAMIDPQPAPALPRQRRLPERGEVVRQLIASLGSPYVWGGNVREGVPALLDTYFRGPFTRPEQQRLDLAGLDCSGLLYQATGGWTPRNTSDLIHYGQPVLVAGRTASQIAALLQPLDLIVWNGHVLIVLDREKIIESRLECGRAGNGGVVITALKRRLEEIMRTRHPADQWPAGKWRDIFVVRRWYGL